MKRVKDLKLSIKLIIVGMIAVVIPMLIVGGITVNKASNALLESGRQSTYRVAEDLAQTAELFMTQEVKFASEIAISTQLTETIKQADEQGIEGAMETILALDSFFKHAYERVGKDYDLFFIADKQGMVISDSMDGALRKKAVNVADRDYFKAVQEGKVVIGHPIQSRASGRAVVVVSVPLKNSEGKFIGAFCSVIRLDTLSSKLTNVKVGETGYAFMVDKDGVVITHPNPEFLFKLNIKKIQGMERISARILAKESGSDLYVFKGTTKVAGFSYLPKTGWSIGVTVNRAELMTPVSKMMTYSLIAGIAAMLLVGGFILWSAFKIITPINAAAAGLKDISEGDGDLTKRLEVTSEDEVGQLSISFNNFIGKLHDMISDITGDVQTLSTSSGGLTKVSDKMSNGAGRTSEKTSGMSDAVREMTENMKTVSETMEKSSANINTVASAADQMYATVEEIFKNTEKARAISGNAVSKVEVSTGRMDQLGSAAQSIGQVVETITDISEQVNLLSLNATIEAARAGEAGRGFAVVANEIKELASQTSDASMSIKEKIDNIQESASVTSEGITEIAQVINDVNEIVATIAVAVEEQSAATREIAENIAQASKGIHDVNDNIRTSSQTAGNISQNVIEVSQEAVDMAAQSAQVQENAANLSELATGLGQMVKRFKI